MAINGLTAGNILILKLHASAVYRKADKTSISPLRGEVELKIEEAGQKGADVSLARMGLYGPGHDEVGQVSLRGLQGEGIIDGASLRLDFSAGVTYSALEDERYRAASTLDLSSTWRELFVGQLRVDLPEAPGLDQWPVFLDKLSLEAQEVHLGLIEEIRNSPSAIEAAGRARRYDLQVLPCHLTFRRIRKVIRIRPVFFKLDDDDPGTGRGWPDHLSAAQKIWRKCGIDVSAPDPPLISTVSESLREGQVQSDVFNSFLGTPGTMSIFFVAGSLSGPGVTRSEGTAFAKSIISDQAVDNVNVLAHELGHMLDGADAGLAKPTTTTTWVGERCTVLMPATAIPARNTFHNCTSVKNDSLESFEPICLDPDASVMSC